MLTIYMCSICYVIKVLGFEVDAINSVQFSNHTGESCISSVSDTYLGCRNALQMQWGRIPSSWLAAAFKFTLGALALKITTDCICNLTVLCVMCGH